MNELLLRLSEGYAAGFGLHLLRAMAFLAVVPLFGTPTSARMLRVVLAAAIGALTFWTSGTTTAELRGLPDLFLLGMREVLLGLLAGFAVHIVLSAARTAGEFLSNEMGLSVARVLDPLTGSQDAAGARLVEVLGLLIAFQLDMHHECVRLLLATHESAPVGSGFDLADMVQGLSATVAQALVLTLKIGLPLFALLALSTGALLVLGRALPGMNLLDFGYGVRSILGLVGALLFLPTGLEVFADGALDGILEWITRFTEGN
ncbi:MAG: flagellar biosynthetic protein FliR [Planctomycetota bacterium]